MPARISWEGSSIERAHAEAEVGGPLERLARPTFRERRGPSARRVAPERFAGDGRRNRGLGGRRAGREGRHSGRARTRSHRRAESWAAHRRADCAPGAGREVCRCHRAGDCRSPEQHRRRVLRGSRHGRADTRGDPSLSRSGTSQGHWTGCRSDAAFRVRLVHVGIGSPGAARSTSISIRVVRARRAARTSDSRKRESVRRPRSPPYSMHRSTVHVPTGGS